MQRISLLARLVAAAGVLSSLIAPLRAEDAAAVEKRLLDAASYLASDELEGRGVGSQGLDLAAEYIAQQFRSIGLKTEVVQGSPFQKFQMTTGAKLGKKNEITLVGPGKDGRPVRHTLKMGDDFMPLALGGSGALNHQFVFAGYGITAKKENYDDYQDLDVTGKCVIILRHEPQQANPHSVFEGTKNSIYAPFMRKLSNAYEHGAAAVIFVTDEFEIRKNVAQRQKRWQEALDKLAEAHAKFSELKDPTLEQVQEHLRTIDDLAAQVRSQGDKLKAEFDPLLKFDIAGLERGRDFPVISMRRKTLDGIVKAALGKDLAELEQAIDKGPTPHSRELSGWRIEGQTTVERTLADVKNVVAVLDGEGPLADETIVIGAHYDHVGRGGPGSGAIDPNLKEIHNGADDNASGTATLIEVARQLAAAERKPRRRIVFLAFTGEERGLHGSDYYVKNPLFPLETTVAMLNMDMVGRLTDDKLIVEGVGTGEGFETLVDHMNKRYGFELTKKPGGFGPSDHASFYGKQIPVMHFFTGTHKDYHRPTDDAEKLNAAGMRRIGQFVTDIALALAEAKERPKYKETASSQRFGGGGGDRPYFGSIPDFAQNDPGYAITGVTKGSPAEKAGLKGGDVIVRLGESRIGNLEDFDSALRKYKGGDRVPVVVRRDGKEVTLEVTLGDPR